MKRTALLLLCALALAACHDRDRDKDKPGSICGSVTVPVDCDGSFAKVLDGGRPACPPGCAINPEPCERLFTMDEAPAGCSGYDCLHVTICPCDGSACVPGWR